MKFGSKYQCQITQFASGKKVVGTRVKEKKYKSGSILELTYVNGSNVPNGFSPVFITNDGYMLPKMYVYPLQEISSAKHSNAEGFEDAQVVSDGSNSPKIPKKDIKLLPNLKDSSKKVVNFGLTGGAIGLLYAFNKGGSKPLFTIIGLTAGLYVGNLLTKKQK